MRSLIVAKQTLTPLSRQAVEERELMIIHMRVLILKTL
jgi:hypothetical protein